MSDETQKAQTAQPTEDTIFGKIVRKEVPVDFLHEDEQVAYRTADHHDRNSLSQCVAFHDMHKQAPVHFLVIPKQPIQQISLCTSADEAVSRLILLLPISDDFYSAPRSSVDRG